VRTLFLYIGNLRPWQTVRAHSATGVLIHLATVCSRFRRFVF